MTKKKIKEDRYTVKRPYDLDKYPDALMGKEEKPEEDTKVVKVDDDKEQSRATVNKEYELDRFDNLVDKVPEDTIFHKRAIKYWDEVYGIMSLLNWANPKIRIVSPDSPYVMQFLVWRLLSEMKGVKATEQKLHKAIKELKINFGVFTEKS